MVNPMNKKDKMYEAQALPNLMSDEGQNSLIYDQPINTKNILTFTFPTMVRMLFVSMYTIVDGIVVSNYVGSLGLSALNIVYPVLNVVMALTFVFQMGSNAVIGKKLGEGKTHEACSFLSLTVLVNLAVMAIMMTLLLTFDQEIYLRIGSDETLLPLCVEYGRIMVLAGPIWSLQILFQGFLVTADRPHMGLWLSVAAGCVNIGLDLLLVGVFDFGLAGAGYASMAGMFVGGLVPLRVFFDKKSLLHFEKPVWKGKELLLAMGNGASEMVTSLSSAITTALFNLQMMAIVGEKGVAAISAILYLQFVFVALLIGFTSGVAPIFSYNYGAGNRANIHKLFAISARMILSFSLAMLVVAELLDRPMVLIFASKDPVLRDLMIVGFRIIAISVFFTGINIFASGFFTAMNNGRVSALVSILRTLVLEVGALLLMPMWWGINGVWWALPVAEILASLVAVSMLLRYRKTYGY